MMIKRLLFSSVLGAALFSFLMAFEPATAVIAQGQSSAKASGRPLIGNIKNSSVVEGCGCYFQFPSESRKRNSNRFVFWSESEQEALMNIDGRDTKLKLVNSTNPPQEVKVGSRSSDTYTTSDGKITIRFDKVVTQMCKPGDEDCEFTAEDATITTFKGGRRGQAIKVTGGCGC